MRKTWIVILVLIMSVIVLNLLANSSDTTPQLPTIVPSNDDEVTFLRYLELGHLYEKQQDTEKAIYYFERAALANQTEIAVSAHVALDRILLQKKDPIVGIRKDIRSFMRVLVTFGTPITILLTFLTCLWFLIGKIWIRPGYYFAVFEDYTSNNIGKGFNNLLLSFISEAIETHRLGQSSWANINSLEIPYISTTLEENIFGPLFDIDTLKLANIEISPSKSIQNILRQINRREFTLQGALYQHGNQVRVSAELIQTNAQKIIKRWDLSAEDGDVNGCIKSLTQQLAYSLLLYIAQAKDLNFSTRLPSDSNCLMLFTKGMQILVQRDYQVYPTLNNQLPRLEIAEDALTQATVIDPAFIPARFLLGIVYLRQAKYDKAQSYLKSVINDQSQLIGESAYYLALGYYYTFQPWSYAGAEYWFNKILEEYIEDKPSSGYIKALTYAGLANVYAQMIGQGDYSKELSRTSTQFVELNHHYSDLANDLISDSFSIQQQKSIEAWILNGRGIAAYQQSNYDEAINLLNIAFQVYSDNPIAYGYTALAWLQKGDPNEAQRWLERASQWQAFGTYLEYGYFKIGEHYEEKNDIPEAKHFYLMAPRISRARYRLAKLYAQQGNYLISIEQLQKALSLDKTNVHIWANLAYYLALSAPQDKIILAQAAEAGLKAVQLSINTSLEWKRRAVYGWILSLLGSTIEAKQQLDTAIKIKHHALVYYYRAELYINMRNNKQAIQELKKAININSNDRLQIEWKIRSKELLLKLTASS